MDIELLGSIPLFSELSDEDLESISKQTVRQVYKKDNMVLIEEEIGSTMFVILDGRVKISRISDEGREVILSILVDGDFFGEMSILDGQTRSANAVTLEDTEMLIVRRENFLQMLYDYPQIAINLLKELAHRLRRSDSQIKSLSLQNALGRVASTILRIADDSGTIKHGKVEISSLPPQQDLANMAGTSRETISRVIKSLNQLGYVKKEGSKLIILEYDRFRQDFS
ncbi:MAG: Crp/Fnr family transcriptional regulator [Calditrichaeota bacterium]|nr:MAG: Crp/Fnr family transcriptional regulator [Calditrichota bacterium]MBL1204258.1 Crp/Fnr family transcriptional regulator [Calditrichota bacterium]NOG44088.1 Crp/Fnr family transcriptional regulator [Calditrichota bacterium]